MTFDFEELKDIPIPQLCHVEHLKLILNSDSSTYTGIMNGILWCCHPETLEVHRTNEGHENFVKVFGFTFLDAFQ